jgi:hypothetical protein
MDHITERELKELADHRVYPCVSLFMPTFRKGREVEQNHIIFKNLLDQARDMLGQENRLVDKMEPLAGDSLFWSRQDDGLALFISKDTNRMFRLPLHFNKEVMISDSFHLKPVLRMFRGNGRFYLLLLSANSIKLYRGTHYSLGEVDLKDTPLSLEEALKYDVPQEHVQFHTGTPSQGEKRAAEFHGQGVGKDGRLHKKDLLRFFQKVDKGVHEALAGDTSPLVLAGVDHIIPLYREASSYPYIAGDHITGNPENAELRELHSRSWDIVRPGFLKEEGRMREKFIILKERGSELVSGDLKKIVRSSYLGKTEAIFTASGEHRWGRYDPKNTAFRIDRPRKKDSHDLLDRASVDTIKHGGKVFIVDKEDVPGKTSISAIFRK